MTERKITIAGQEIPVAFNGAALISFEQISGTPFFDDQFKTQASRVALIFAAIYAANDKTTVKIEDIMHKASWKELNDAFTQVIEASADFFEMPEILKNIQEDKPEDDEKVKN